MMATAHKSALNGREKAAIFLISLGPDLSAQVMKCMKEEDIDVLTLRSPVLKGGPGSRDQVLSEFADMAIAQQYIDEGGIEYAKILLEKAVGKDKAVDVLGRLTPRCRSGPSTLHARRSRANCSTSLSRSRLRPSR